MDYQELREKYLWASGVSDSMFEEHLPMITKIACDIVCLKNTQLDTLKPGGVVNSLVEYACVPEKMDLKTVRDQFNKDIRLS